MLEIKRHLYQTFALTGSSSKWIDGSSTLRKYAKYCGAQHPDRLTSTRLRKQIAIMLQILNLNDVEMEQVVAFMGHNKSIKLVVNSSCV